LDERATLRTRRSGRAAKIDAVEYPARITVRRPERPYRDRLRSYGIEIDGVRVGTVATGEQIDFPVGAGAHDVRAVIDWTGSPPVHLEVPPGGRARLLVEPAGNSFQFWKLWKRDSYLELTVEQP
jgi:hypothetical protein